MTLTDRQKKLAWIVGGILLAIHFAPGLWSSARQAWTSRDQASHSQKPSPTHYAPAVPPTPAPVPAPSPDAQFAKLMGIWYGTGIKPGSTDFCHLKLELHTDPAKPGLYTAYSTRSCGPVPFMSHNTVFADRTAEIIRKMTPTSTILTGPVENGSIHLKLEQSIGTSADGCEPNAYTLTPFGDTQLAAHWDDDHCAGGQYLMGRSPR